MAEPSRREDMAPLAVAAIALIALAPALLIGPIATDSGFYTYAWTRQLGESMARGEIYPRWLPDSFDGLGSPTFYFYPPLAFLVAGGLKAAGLPLALAVTGAATLFELASGLAMYAWLRPTTRWALAGAALYMLAPFHLSEFYLRGDLAEFAAYAWFPLLAGSITRLPAPGAAAMLAASWAGLIMTSLPVAVLATLFLAAPLAVGKAIHDRRALLAGVAGAALGLGLAAIYLLPALTLQRYVSFQVLRAIRPDWAFADLLAAPAKLVPWFVAVPLAAILLASRAPRPWLAVVVVAAICASGAAPIWGAPILRDVQFPWRLDAVLEFAAISCACLWPPKRLIAALAAAAAIQAYWATPLDMNVSADHFRAEGLNPLTATKEGAEYLPAGAETPRTGVDAPITLPRAEGALAPTPVIRVARAGRLTLRRAAFPIWSVRRDGRAVPTSGPLITFEATPGLYELVRTTTPAELVGAAVSTLALVLTAGLALWGRWRRQPSIDAPLRAERLANVAHTDDGEVVLGDEALDEA